MLKLINILLIGLVAILALLICVIVVPPAFAWGGNTHEDQAYYAGKYMHLSEDESQILSTNSIVPDNPEGQVEKWDVLVYPGTNIVIPYISTLCHSIKHSYLVDVAPEDPYPVVNFLYEDLLYTWDCQHAAINASINANIAKNYLDKNSTNYNPVEGYKHLGYAMHYMSDCSMPMHTTIHGLDKFDNGYEPIGTFPWKTTHGAYEMYEGSNWYSYQVDPHTHNNSLYYRKYLENHNPEDYYEIDDPETAAQVMACISYLSSEYIIDKMENDPENWENDDGVQFSTGLCVEEGLKFDMGLISYVEQG